MDEALNIHLYICADSSRTVLQTQEVPIDPSSNGK